MVLLRRIHLATSILAFLSSFVEFGPPSDLDPDYFRSRRFVAFDLVPLRFRSTCRARKISPATPADSPLKLKSADRGPSLGFPCCGFSFGRCPGLHLRGSFRLGLRRGWRDVLRGGCTLSIALSLRGSAGTGIGC